MPESAGTVAGGSVVISSSSAGPRPFRTDAVYLKVTRRFAIADSLTLSINLSSEDGVIREAAYPRTRGHRPGRTACALA